MMKTGLLWFDSDRNLSVAEKAKRAADFYAEKHGTRPNLCFVHPAMLLNGPIPVEGLQIRASNSVLPWHFWLGVADAPEAPKPRPAPRKDITTIDNPRIIPGLQEINEAIQRDLWKAFTGPLLLPAPIAERAAPAPVCQQLLCLPAPSQLPGPHVDEMWDRYADQILDLIREEKRKAKKAARILQRLLQDEKPLRSETITLDAPKEQPAPQSISRQLADAPAAQPAVLPQALQSPAEAIRQLAEQKAKPAALNVDQAAADYAREFYNAHGYFPRSTPQANVEVPKDSGPKEPAQREVKEYYNGIKIADARHAIKAFERLYPGVQITQIRIPCFGAGGKDNEVAQRRNVLGIQLYPDQKIHKGKMQLVGMVSQ